MKLDTTHVPNGLDGTPFTRGDVPLTVGEICVTALLGTYPSEKIDGEEKAKRFRLAVSLSKPETVDLKAADIVLLKKVIGFGFPPLVVGRLYEILEPET